MEGKSTEFMELYVSTTGNDRWSGRYPEPNADQTDGPVTTIEMARNIIRRLKGIGKLYKPVNVWIRGGRYILNEPITFTDADSWPVTYAPYQDEQVFIESGKTITGWKVEKLGTIDVWVTEIQEVVLGKKYFRQLFVNGERRQRTRLPKSGYYRMENVPGLDRTIFFGDQVFNGTDVFNYKPGHIKNWKNINDVDVIVDHAWVDERMPIETIDESTRLVKSNRKSVFALMDDVTDDYSVYFVENVFEALSEPGEWYLDRSNGKLHYIPMPGEKIEEVEIIAPNLEQLIKIKGKPEENKYVDHIRFENITFQYTDWHQPKLYGMSTFGFLSENVATSPQAGVHVPGAIYLEGARYCTFEECKISHAGFYGIELADGCFSNSIVGNEISDIGAGGIKVNGSDAKGLACRRTGNNRITDNSIFSGGNVFRCSVGILMVHSFGNLVSHNHIHHLFYTGISSGFLWGYEDNVCKDNVIEKNNIHDIGMGAMSDMGGIYTLGVQPGTVIRGNVIHDIVKKNYGGNGLYLDQASSNIVIENNIIYNVSSHGIAQHYGRENLIRNNIIAFCGEECVHPGKLESHNAITFIRNIVITNGKPVFAVLKPEACNFTSDLNLYWNASEKINLEEGSKSIEDSDIKLTQTTKNSKWIQEGYDLHSIYENPLLQNLSKFNFKLCENSPAITLGFKDIDISDVGPRSKDCRKDYFNFVASEWPYVIEI
jgi:hypothetical protein